MVSRIEKIRAEQLTRYKIEQGTGCWIWIGGKDKDGYGKIKRYGKNIRAHRLFYEHHVGSIPEGLFVIHSCDNPSCVNPKHLRPATQLENEQDKDNKGRRPLSPSITHKESLLRGEAHPRFGKPMLEHVKEALHKANSGRSLSNKHKENLSCLTINEVNQILLASGTNAEIALKYGVSRSTIQRIRSGVRWQHISKDFVSDPNDDTSPCDVA